MTMMFRRSDRLSRLVAGDPEPAVIGFGEPKART
jgi:hypothetical protein